MAEVSVAAAVSEGFAIIRRRPLAVLAWGLVYVVWAALIFAVLAPVYINMFQAIRAASPGSLAQNPYMMQGQVMRMQGVMYLVDFASLLVASVLYCAVFRAVLHPERGRFAYLRIGAPELYLFAVVLVGAIAMVIGMVIAMIPLAIIIGVLSAMHIVAAAVIVGLAGGIALFAGVIYVVLRMAFVGPMMVDDGQFHLGDAWALTRGKVGGLFLTALVLFAMIIVAEIVIGILFFALSFGALSAMAGGVAGLQTLFQRPPQELLSTIGPVAAIAAVIGMPFLGAFFAIVSAPWARAYRDVRPTADVSEAFV